MGIIGGLGGTHSSGMAERGGHPNRPWSTPTAPTIPRPGNRLRSAMRLLGTVRNRRLPCRKNRFEGFTQRAAAAQDAGLYCSYRNAQNFRDLLVGESFYIPQNDRGTKQLGHASQRRPRSSLHLVAREFIERRWSRIR